MSWGAVELKMLLLRSVLMSIAALENLLSFSLNIFIVVFYIRSLWQGKPLNPPSLIQLIMGVLNVSMQGMMLGSSIVLWLPSDHAMMSYHAIILIVRSCLNFSHWLVVWLSVYYCTTITNIRCQAFIWMKRNLVSFLPHLLCLSAVGSFAWSIQMFWYLKIQAPHGNSTLHRTLFSSQLSTLDLNEILFNYVTFSVPFMITLSSLLVTMSSLIKHVRKVKSNDSGFAPPKLQAHVSAVRTMLFFLVLSLIVTAFETVKLLIAPFMGQYAKQIVPLVVDLFAVAEASIIIQSSRKLKERFAQMFCAQRMMRGQT